MASLDERANGQRVTLAMGAEVVLDLAENPTTGYRWNVESAGAPALAMGGDYYEAPSSGQKGAAGRHSWSFRAVAPGNATIRLTYRRGSGDAANTFAVEVDVQAA